jgi:hypothetical protein
MESIKDKVAIVGMGCTKFGERWDKGALAPRTFKRRGSGRYFQV